MPVQSIYEKALDLLEKGEDLVLCVIVATAGSTPRGPGSKMLVGRDGIPMGTVGGGQVEYKAVQMAGTLMGSRGYRLVEHELVQDGTGRSDGVCGGRVRLLFLPMDPGDMAFCSALRQIVDMERTREKGWVSFELKEGDWKIHAWASENRRDFLGAPRVSPRRGRAIPPATPAGVLCGEAMWGKLCAGYW